MANASAFGFSGYDPWGSFLEGHVNEYFAKRAASTNFKYQRKAMKYQYELMLRSLGESPSAQREGLIKAGYNPLLAISNGLSHPFSGSSSSSYMSTPDISSATNGFDASGFAMAKEAFKREKVATDNLRKEGELLDARKRETDALSSKHEMEGNYLDAMTRGTNVKTGTDVLDGIETYIDLMDRGNETSNTKRKGSKTKTKKNTSLRSSAKTPRISKGGGNFMEVLKTISPALLWSARSAPVAAGAMLLPLIDSSLYQKGNSAQGRGTNKWYPHGNWSR